MSKKNPNRTFRTLGQRMQVFGRGIMRTYAPEQADQPVQPQSNRPRGIWRALSESSLIWRQEASIAPQTQSPVDADYYEGQSNANYEQSNQPVQRRRSKQQAPQSQQPAQQKSSNPAQETQYVRTASGNMVPLSRKQFDNSTQSRLDAIMRAHQEQDEERTKLREQKRERLENSAADASLQRQADTDSSRSRRRRGNLSVDYVETSTLLPPEERAKQSQQSEILSRSEQVENTDTQQSGEDSSDSPDDDEEENYSFDSELPPDTLDDFDTVDTIDDNDDAPIQRSPFQYIAEDFLDDDPIPLVNEASVTEEPVQDIAHYEPDNQDEFFETEDENEDFNEGDDDSYPFRTIETHDNPTNEESPTSATSNTPAQNPIQRASQEPQSSSKKSDAIPNEKNRPDTIAPVSSAENAPLQRAPQMDTIDSFDDFRNDDKLSFDLASEDSSAQQSYPAEQDEDFDDFENDQVETRSNPSVQSTPVQRSSQVEQGDNNDYELSIASPIQETPIQRTSIVNDDAEFDADDDFTDDAVESDFDSPAQTSPQRTSQTEQVTYKPADEANDYDSGFDSPIQSVPPVQGTSKLDEKIVFNQTDAFEKENLSNTFDTPTQSESLQPAPQMEQDEDYDDFENDNDPDLSLNSSLHNESVQRSDQVGDNEDFDEQDDSEDDSYNEIDWVDTPDLPSQVRVQPAPQFQQDEDDNDFEEDNFTNEANVDSPLDLASQSPIQATYQVDRNADTESDFEEDDFVNESDVKIAFDPVSESAIARQFDNDDDDTDFDDSADFSDLASAPSQSPVQRASQAYSELEDEDFDDSDDFTNDSFDAPSQSPVQRASQAYSELVDEDFDDSDDFANDSFDAPSQSPVHQASQDFSELVDEDFDDSDDFTNSSFDAPSQSPVQRASQDFSQLENEDFDDSDDFTNSSFDAPSQSPVHRVAQDYSEPVDEDFDDSDDFANGSFDAPSQSPVHRVAQDYSELVDEDFDDSDDFTNGSFDAPSQPPVQRVAQVQQDDSVDKEYFDDEIINALDSVDAPQRQQNENYDFDDENTYESQPDFDASSRETSVQRELENSYQEQAYDYIEDEDYLDDADGITAINILEDYLSIRPSQPASETPSTPPNKQATIQRRTNEDDSDTYDDTEQAEWFNPSQSDPVSSPSPSIQRMPEEDLESDYEEYGDLTWAELHNLPLSSESANPSQSAIQRMADEDDDYSYTNDADFDEIDDRAYPTDEDENDELLSMDLHQALAQAGLVPPPVQTSPSQQAIQRAPQDVYHDVAEPDNLQTLDLHQALAQAGLITSPTRQTVNPLQSPIQRMPQEDNRLVDYDEDEISYDDADYDDNDAIDLFQAMQAAGLVSARESSSPTRQTPKPIQRAPQESPDELPEIDVMDALMKTGLLQSTVPNQTSDPIARQEVSDAPQMIQREETNTDSGTVAETNEPASSEEIEQLARDVFRVLKNRLRMERERRTRN